MELNIGDKVLYKENDQEYESIIIDCDKTNYKNKKYKLCLLDRLYWVKEDYLTLVTRASYLSIDDIKALELVAEMAENNQFLQPVNAIDMYKYFEMVYQIIGKSRGFDKFGDVSILEKMYG